MKQEEIGKILVVGGSTALVAYFASILLETYLGRKGVQFGTLFRSVRS